MAVPDPLAPARRALALTRAAMGLERLLQALWLPGSLVILGAALWAFDLHSRLPGDAALWLTGAMGLSVVVTLVLGLWRFRWPSLAEAVARLDRSLPGRPLAALTDAQALGGDDPGSAALWKAHRARMAQRAAQARPVPPAPGLVQRDPHAIRLVALTAGAVALLFATPGAQGPMAGLPGAAGAAVGPAWEGWIVPPAHTGRPGLYLNEILQPQFEVPQGSRVILRFYGAPGALQLEQTLDAGVRADETGQALEFDARASGRITIDGPGGRDWQVAVLPDAVPQVEPGALTRGRGGVMEQAFSARDDYAVVSGEAVITLDLAAIDRRHGLTLPPEPREALRLVLPMPMSGPRANIDDTLREDLSQHPWANLPVRIALSATDALGQTGTTAETPAILPGRRFFEPAAQSLAELRRDLLWSLDNAPRAAMLMRAMIHRPEGAFTYEDAPVRIRGAVDYIETRLLAGTLTPEARDDLAAQIWDLILLIEEGELANARARLQRARERLDEAMRNGADPAEIAELMDELREATRDYMEMLAEQAEPADDGGDQRDQGEQQGEAVTQSQIQEMMDQIQRLMEEGRMEEAAELMAQLNALLDNLQMQRGEGGDPMPGAEEMEGLGNSLEDQQSLADETFEELQDSFGSEGEAGKDAEQRAEELAERQRELAERLREQQLGDLPGEGTDEGDEGLSALDEAQRQMDRAAEALEEGDLRGALERQAEALEQLRDGLRSLREARSADAEERQNEDGSPQGQAAGRDPLGREQGEGREGDQLGSILPGEDPRQRARDLMDEIRRRSAERERPEDERDYLNRLIERF